MDKAICCDTIPKSKIDKETQDIFVYTLLKVTNVFYFASFI